MKIKVNQTVTTVVEQEINLPIFLKEKNTSYPVFVSITEETEYTRLYFNGGYASILTDDKASGASVAEYFTDRYEPISQQEFNEQIKKAIDVIGRAACKFAEDYIIETRDIPTIEIQ